METKISLQQLKKLSVKLLNKEINDLDAQEIINEINSSFQDLTGIYGKDVDLEHLACLPGETGQALSLNHAAECLLDYKRTTKFLRGFVEAIKDKQAKYPKETIHIFYAGCGPFAPFLTMVSPLFSPKEVQFSLLEINPKSLETAKTLIQKLELTNYVQEYYLADAITFKIPNPEQYHILFSETLDALLHRECYVPILWNLLPQLSENVTVIPENVLVTVNYKKDNLEQPFVTAFDTREALKATPKTDLLPEKLEMKSFSLNGAEDYFSIVLDTVVKIYKEEVLERSESSLTLAIEVPIEKPVIHEFVDFVYNLKPTPSLQFGVR